MNFVCFKLWAHHNCKISWGYIYIYIIFRDYLILYYICQVIYPDGLWNESLSVAYLHGTVMSPISNRHL